MSRMIDADALYINIVSSVCRYCDDENADCDECIAGKALKEIDNAPTVNIDWTKHETTTGDSKSVTVNPAYPHGTGNPAYPLGGGGNYQCSNTVDVVPVKSIEQLKWERDTAIQQLEEHGIPFCGKAEDVVRVVRCGDCKHFERAYYKKDGTENFKYKRGVCCRKKRGMWVTKDWYCAAGERKDDA